MNEKIKELSEQIQDDLICLIDSLFPPSGEMVNLKNFACQVVVDKVKEFLEKNKI